MLELFLMMLCKPRLRPGFTGIDDNIVVPLCSSIFLYLVVFFHIHFFMIIQASPGVLFNLCELLRIKTSSAVRHILYFLGRKKAVVSILQAVRLCSNSRKSNHITHIKHLFASNENTPLPHSCLSRPRSC